MIAATPTRPALDRCLSVRGTARYLAVAPVKVRRWIRRGMLRAIDVGGGRLRIEPGAIAELGRLLAAKPDRRSARRRDEVDPEVEALLRDDRPLPLPAPLPTSDAGKRLPPAEGGA